MSRHLSRPRGRRRTRGAFCVCDGGRSRRRQSRIGFDTNLGSRPDRSHGQSRGQNHGRRRGRRRDHPRDRRHSRLAAAGPDDRPDDRPGGGRRSRSRLDDHRGCTRRLAGARGRSAQSRVGAGRCCIEGPAGGACPDAGQSRDALQSVACPVWACQAWACPASACLASAYLAWACRGEIAGELRPWGCLRELRGASGRLGEAMQEPGLGRMARGAGLAREQRGAAVGRRVVQPRPESAWCASSEWSFRPCSLCPKTSLMPLPWGYRMKSRGSESGVQRRNAGWALKVSGAVRIGGVLTCREKHQACSDARVPRLSEIGPACDRRRNSPHAITRRLVWRLFRGTTLHEKRNGEDSPGRNPSRKLVVGFPRPTTV